MKNSKKPSTVQKFLFDYLANTDSDASRFFMEDPTVKGFKLIFEFNQSPPNFPYDTTSPLFNETDQGESAIRYLQGIGEDARAQSLKDFKLRLRNINNFSPHYFQQMDGLEEMYRFDPTNPNRMDERELEITTLESIDNRISGMIEMYMRAVYDFDYHRVLLPENMMEFSLTILVYEIRDFRTFTGNFVSGSDIPEFKILKNEEDFGVHEYKFSQCVFDFTASNPYMASLNNRGGAEYAENSFKIKLGRLETRHRLALGDVLAQANQYKLPNQSMGVPANVIEPDIPGVGGVDDLGDVDAIQAQRNEALSFFNRLGNEILDTVQNTVRSQFDSAESYARARFSEQLIDRFGFDPLRVFSSQDSIIAFLEGIVRNNLVGLGAFPGENTISGLLEKLLGGIGLGRDQSSPGDVDTPDQSDFTNPLGLTAIPKQSDFTNPLGVVDVPKPTGARRETLGENNDALSKFALLADNIAGFEEDPDRAFIESLILGSLGTVMTAGR